MRPPLWKSSAAALRWLRSLGWTTPHKPTHTHTQRRTRKHTHLLSPRVDSTAVPVGRLRDLDDEGQNKVYTIVGKIGASRKISTKTNARYLTNYIPDIGEDIFAFVPLQLPSVVPLNQAFNPRSLQWSPLTVIALDSGYIRVLPAATVCDFLKLHIF